MEHQMTSGFSVVRVCSTGALLLIVFACGSPQDRDSESQITTTQAVISDQLHNGGKDGFFWLPPLVQQPVLTGVFDPTLAPVLDITGPASETVAHFTTTTGPGSETIRVDQSDPHFVVNWHTDQFGLTPGSNYRVTVKLGEQPVGYFDVSLAANQQQARNVNTGEYIPLVNGRTLPIKWFMNACGGVFCQASDQCHMAGTCDPSTGQCSNPAQPDNTRCDDGNACTQLDNCQVGTCVGSEPVDCASPDQCHDAGTCDPGTGTCSNPPKTDSTVCVNHATCQSGLCSSAICELGFADCNQSASDGCEANLSADLNHCGTCGHACAGGSTCVDGVCAGGLHVANIAAGGLDSAALLSDGTLRTWGWNWHGELGNGTNTCTASQSQSRVPVAVTNITNAVALSVGWLRSCAVLSNGTVQCWGDNSAGELGIGAATPGCGSSMPLTVSGITDAVTASVGEQHACAIRSGGTVQCWGTGDLGDGTAASSSVPVTVLGVTSAVAIAAGYGFSCALVSGGTMQCWGANSNGELGNGTTTSVLFPSAVSGITNAVGLAAGWRHACAVLGDGTVQCWGANNSGQLGNAAVPTSPVPVVVSGITNAIAVSAGEVHTCALLGDGTVRCWGGNNHGQLGNGTTISGPVPVQVLGTTNMIGIAAGEWHTCARSSDGSVLCWGLNMGGQLGNGTTVTSSVPVRVTGL